MTIRDDIRLLKLDFIHEMGGLICSFGAAVSAAAAAENIELMELGLCQCRAALMEAIAEFRLLANDVGADNDK